MRTDAAFRHAFAATPDDPALRRTYAAWLAEFDRPDLAAAVRDDVERAAVRPWDDAYTLTAPRRPAGGPFGHGWLADRVPLVAGVPDDPVSRWRAARAFVTRWCGGPGLLAVRPDSPVQLHAGGPADALGAALDHRPGATRRHALTAADWVPLVAGLRARLPGYGRLHGLDVFEGPGVAVVVRRPDPVGRVWVFGG